MWRQRLARLKAYGRNLASWASRLFNAALGGDPEEFFSARVYRRALAGLWVWRGLNFCLDGLFFRQKNYCRQAWLSERRPKQFSAGDSL